MEHWYESKPDAVLNKFGTDPSTGLTQQQAEKGLAEHGKNTFETKKKTSLFKRILYQLQDVSVIVLLIATGLSFLLAIREGSGFIEPAVILAIVILNIILAITQEGKAEKALEALEDLSAPTCVVLRDGVRKSIEASELVPGDIVTLETGNVVPADMRLLESAALFSDESALTGESEPAEKDATEQLSGEVPLGDQHNMMFSGCIVTAGHGTAVVTQTGMQTQMGQIAKYLHESKPVKTPLQERLDRLGKMISWIAITAAFFLLAVGLRGGTDFSTMIMAAIALAVAAVPETLSLIVTLSLTNSVQRMAGKNALVRKLAAVETLGNTSVICSDKTGTLTQNRMTVRWLWKSGEDAFAADSDFDDSKNRFLILMALASNATIEVKEDGTQQAIGNATEIGIMRLFEEKGLDKDVALHKFPKVAEVPFSSERKRMTVVLKDPNGGYIVLTKGAIDRLPIDKTADGVYAEALKAHDSFAQQALRVIALAYRHIDHLPDENQMVEVEQDMTLMGLVGLIDPPRPEAKVAIEKAKGAGIRTIMITGDHAATASAIAKELGILEEGQKAITGTQLAAMTDTELFNTVRNYSVYARVSPEDKIRIVEAWQANGEVVAMTGDGVNDVPALKAADVGVAMGKTGTEVTKNASDMILTDDNFATIVEAVGEGRNVYENIRNTVYFLLVCNIGEIIIMLFAQMAGWGILLTPVMLLLINLLGDGIPGLQLAREVSDENLMDRKPIKRDASFFTGDMIKCILRQTAICSAVSLLAYFIGAFVPVSSVVSPSAAIGQTMAFLAVGWTSILHIFNVRSKKSVFKASLKNSKMLVASAAIMIIVMGLLAATPIGGIFGLSSISGVQWLIVAGLSIVPTLARELWRLIDNNPNVIARNRRFAERMHGRAST